MAISFLPLVLASLQALGQQKSPTLAQIDPKFAHGQLSVVDAIGLSYRLNPEIKQAELSMRVAEARKHQVASVERPAITLGPNESLIKHEFEEGFQAQLQVPIDISGTIQAAKNQADFEAIAAKLAVNQAQNDTAYRVTAAYLTALRAKAIVAVLLEDEKNAEQRKTDAQARYEAKTVAYIDVLRAETSLADSQQRLSVAQNAARLALTDLDRAVGLDTDEEPRLQELMQTPTTDGMPGSYKQAEDLAVKSRPEVLGAIAETKAAQFGIKLANRSELPSFAIGVGYFDARSTTGTRYREPQALIGLNIPIFDGGLAAGRRDEAKAIRGKAETQLRQEVDRVKSEVLRGFVARDEALGRVKVAEVAVTEAKQAFELAQVRYNAGVASKAGLSPLLELNDAQEALAQAQENLLNANYDLLLANALIKYSTAQFAYGPKL